MPAYINCVRKKGYKEFYVTSTGVESFDKHEESDEPCRNFDDTNASVISDSIQDKKMLQKTCKVSDPNMWYQKEYITARMFFLTAEENTVRIIFESCDDFYVYRDFKEWDSDANWKWCEKWLWDKIPETVSCDWLYEHGYCPY